MSLNGENNLGYYLLAVLYFSISMFSPFSSAILKRWGVKSCLFIGGFGHFCFVLASILPAWRREYHNEPDPEKGKFERFVTDEKVVITCLVAGAILNGFGAAILWVAQGEYISKCTLSETQGFYFGYFWSIHQASQILSCVLSTLLFQYNFDKTTFAKIMSIVALVGTLMFFFVQKPYVHEI